MYKLLLCWRYLRTRYIALASVISVTLGVATMIVVNSVMSGFSFEMKSRIHGILSDVIFESHSMSGFHDAEYHMEQIMRVAGDYIAGMTPTVHVPAMLTFKYGGKMVTRQVTLIGSRPETAGNASSLPEFLQHPENRKRLSFNLREGGYDTLDRQSGEASGDRDVLADAGWPYRRWWAAREQAFEFDAEQAMRVPPPEFEGGEQQAAAEQAAEQAAGPAAGPKDPFAAAQPKQNVFNPMQEQHAGLVLGIALSNYRDQNNKERFLLMPGDDVQLTFPNAGNPPRAINSYFTVVDFYESKMSEYDSTFVFVPIDVLQQDRGMIDPTSKVGYVNSIQIRAEGRASTAIWCGTSCERRFLPSCTTSPPGGTSKGRCWPPCRWKRPS